LYVTPAGDFPTNPQDDPIQDVAPAPLTSFLRSGSVDVSITGSTYGLKAIRFSGTNRTLANVHADITLVGEGMFSNGSLNMELQARTDYQVVVTPKPGLAPPSSLVGIPIIGTATVSATCSGNNVSSVGEVIVFNVAPTPLLWNAPCNGTGSSSKTVPQRGTFPIGVPVDVEDIAAGNMTLFATSPAQPQDHASFSASADPEFEIDPSFEFANDFELQYSPGFETSGDGTGGTQVPEPASLLLLAAAVPLARILKRRAGRL
jgi:hypothetical protein